MEQSDTFRNPFLDSGYEVPTEPEIDHFERALAMTKQFMRAYSLSVWSVLSDAAERCYMEGEHPWSTMETINKRFLSTKFDYDLVESRSSVMGPVQSVPAKMEHLMISGSMPLSVFRWFYKESMSGRVADEMTLHHMLKCMQQHCPFHDVDFFVYGLSGDKKDTENGQFCRKILKMLWYYRNDIPHPGSYDELNRSLKSDPNYKAWGSDLVPKTFRHVRRPFYKETGMKRSVQSRMTSIVSNFNGVKIAGKINIIWRWATCSPDRVLNIFDLTASQIGYIPFEDKLVFSPGLIDAIETDRFSLTDHHLLTYGLPVNFVVQSRINKYTAKGLTYVPPEKTV